MDDVSTEDLLAGIEPEQSTEEQLDKLLADNYFPLKPYRDEDYATSVLDAFDSHLQNIDTTSIGSLLWQAYAAYHLLDGDGFDDTPITKSFFTGEDGEIMVTEVPHFRNLVRQKLTLITEDRLDFQPQAANTDSKSLLQVNTAKQVLNYVMDQLDLAKALKTGLETSMILGSSYTVLTWDPYKGNPTGTTNPVTGNPMYTGDMRWHSLTPMEVAHEPARTYEDANWHVCRTFVSRADLASILRDRGDLETAIQVMEQTYTDLDYQYVLPSIGLDEDSDQIPIYTFFHRKCPALPMGRLTVITGDGLFISDGPLPYPEAPIVRMCPSEFVGTSMPFADSWTWMALADNANALLSIILSRMEHFGHPLLSVPSAEDWAPDDFDGYRIHQQSSDGRGPVLVDSASIPESVPDSYDLIVREMGRVAGIDSVTQGTPDKSISSGSMAALVQSQSIRFASSEEEQYVRSAERVAMQVIQMYQSRADNDLMIAIAGEDGEPDFISFNRDSINAIKRVSIRRSNPLLRTTGAKQDAAQQLLTQGLLKTAEEFFAVWETGRLDVVRKPSVDALATINEENAMIMRGEVPKVGKYENFKLHLMHHKTLEDTYAKEHPEVQQALDKHIAETMAMWQELSIKDPGVLGAMDVPQLPPPPDVLMKMEQDKAKITAGGPSGGPQPPKGPPAKPGPKPGPQEVGVDNKVAQAGPPDGPRMPQPAQVKK